MKTNSSNILIIGGAGFIGSTCSHVLTAKGYNCIVYDNLETGRPEAVTTPIIIGDIRDKATLHKTFAENQIDIVIHLAAKIIPSESLIKPKLYFDVNTQGSINVVEAMAEYGVRNLIFSSTAAVYGDHPSPLTEDVKCRPTTPYGQSKKLAEENLMKWHQRGDINLSVLRFFNAAGAIPESNIGEIHIPEIHVIPKIIRAIKEQETFCIYGDNHPTTDGTCIRDYIHIKDIAQAHCLLIEKHSAQGMGDIYNVGTGQGHSVLDVYQEVCRQMDSTPNYRVEGKRTGDPSVLITDNSKIKKRLHWEPTESSLAKIVADAIRWSNRIIF